MEIKDNAPAITDITFDDIFSRIVIRYYDGREKEMVVSFTNYGVTCMTIRLDSNYQKSIYLSAFMVALISSGLIYRGDDPEAVYEFIDLLGLNDPDMPVSSRRYGELPEWCPSTPVWAIAFGRVASQIWEALRW